MANLPKIALGAWAWGNDGTFGNNLTSERILAGFMKGLPRETVAVGVRQ